LKDRRNYTKCYTELLDADPNFDNYLLLGNALMKINEPEDAVKAFQKALTIK
jgi:tetratricopeptide repeat protein 21B